jgi:hypothetical protein
MSTCKHYSERKIIDIIEGTASEAERKRFDEHRRRCAQCQQEYDLLKRLYTVLDTDEVVLPDEKFFEDLKTTIKRERIERPRFFIPKAIRIFVPVCAAAAVLLFFVTRRAEPTVELEIPASALLADRDIADMSLRGIIDEELISDMSVLEDYAAPGLHHSIGELSREEQTTFIEMVSEKYGNGS